MALRSFLPLIQIVLVVILGRVEGHHLSDLSGGMIAHLHQFTEDLECDVALRDVIEPDAGEILRPDVDALSVGLLKVMDLEEVFDQGFVRDYGGIVIHANGLQMAREASFYLFIAGIVE